MADALGHLNLVGLPLLGRLRKNVLAMRRAPALQLLVMLAACSTHAAAQPAQSVHFTVFSATPVTGLAYAPRAKAAPTALVFYPTARSPRYEYRGTMPLRFLDQATGAVVAEATIPPGINEALLLFSALGGPAANATISATEAAPPNLKYRIAVVEAAAARHPAGQLAVINLSGMNLQGEINGHEVVLEPGLNSPQPAGRSLVIALHTTVKERKFQSYAASVPLKPQQRALLILFPPYYRGSAEVQSRLLLDEPPRREAGR